MGLYITFLNFLYSWRMGRDSNPRWSCPHNGFQDRRNRPLCHPSETVSRRSFKPTVLFAVRTWRCCSPLVRARLRCACLADSYARPSQSTAALTHPKLFSAGLFDKRSVLYSTNIPLSIYLFIILFLACIRNNVILHTNRREIEINKKAIKHV